MTRHPLANRSVVGLNTTGTNHTYHWVWWQHFTSTHPDDTKTYHWVWWQHFTSTHPDDTNRSKNSHIFIQSIIHSVWKIYLGYHQYLGSIRFTLNKEYVGAGIPPHTLHWMYRACVFTPYTTPILTLNSGRAVRFKIIIICFAQFCTMYIVECQLQHIPRHKTILYTE